MKLIISLRRQHHARESARDQHDRLRFDADEINLIKQIAPVEFESKARRHRLPRQQSNPPQPGEPVGEPFVEEKIHRRREIIKTNGALPALDFGGAYPHMKNRCAGFPRQRFNNPRWTIFNSTAAGAGRKF